MWTRRGATRTHTTEASSSPLRFGQRPAKQHVTAPTARSQRLVHFLRLRIRGRRRGLWVH